MNNSVCFLGDICLNNGYDLSFKNKENPFGNIEPLLKNSKLVIGNLECTAWGEDGVNTLKIPRLNTKLETLNFLNNINLKLALLANNHIYDNLESGFRKTISFLESHGINYIGAGFTKEKAREPYIYRINNINIL